MALRPGILRFKKDFDRLYKRGRPVGDKYVVVFQIANGLEYSRKAFLASKKVGGAVARNRARRLMKESYRKIEIGIVSGRDILFIARSDAADAHCADVEKSMLRALNKCGLIKQNSK